MCPDPTWSTTTASNIMGNCSVGEVTIAFQISLSVVTTSGDNHFKLATNWPVLTQFL